MAKTVLVFEENRFGFDSEYGLDDVALEMVSFEVDLDKLQQFKDEHDYEYGYVMKIVEEALDQLNVANGLRPIHLLNGSRKYSFGDCPDWYDSLKPEEGVVADRKLFCYDVYGYAR